MGKTLWARSLGKHAYFGNVFSLDENLTDVEYAVFDDIGGLKFLPSYKFWLGQQKEFYATDKYRHKQKITWARPSIWCANNDPREEDGADVDWLNKNCWFFNIEDEIFKKVEPSKKRKHSEVEQGDVFNITGAELGRALRRMSTQDFVWAEGNEGWLVPHVRFEPDMSYITNMMPGRRLARQRICREGQFRVTDTPWRPREGKSDWEPPTVETNRWASKGPRQYGAPGCDSRSNKAVWAGMHETTRAHLERLKLEGLKR